MQFSIVYDDYISSVKIDDWYIISKSDTIIYFSFSEKNINTLIKMLENLKTHKRKS